MSNIIRELSRGSSSRFLRSHDSSASVSNSPAYNLERSSYKINKFTNSSATSSYSHHIKFNNSKLDEELNQIENQLKIYQTLFKKFLFLKKSLSQIFSPIMINLL